ncbi:hypothetical protein [Microbacterium sp. A1-JK]|uniref:hypothetical protein n=1 Tax=Microbacterium sp. A1-JK TaxID=3177516 RepID=UPI00388785F5
MSLFGVQEDMSRDQSGELESFLATVLNAQLGTSTVSISDASGVSIEGLEHRLKALKRWFDPIASGKRLRDEVSLLPRLSITPLPSTDQLVLSVGRDRWLVTPEGVVVLWLLQLAHGDYPEDNRTRLPAGSRLDALKTLATVYKTWNEQRLRGVTDLLQGETATLRPTAAGLLFVLLVNRNTDRTRRLPPPRNAAESEEISRAIAFPTLAFAHALSRREKASERGLDLYRGWALGELARRLGEGLHQGSEGIWIDPEWELAARLRLREALVGRPEVELAIDSALSAYEAIRPVLSGLNIAFERPSYTRRLREELVGWAVEGAPK